jgi:hypothetical protein
MKKLLMLMLVLTAVPAHAGNKPWIWYGLNGAPAPQQHRDNDRQRYDNNDPYRRQHERWNSGNGDFQYSGNQIDARRQNRSTTMTCNPTVSVCVSQQ